MSNKREATFHPGTDLAPAVNPGYVRGYAFAGPETKAEHENAQAELKAMDLTGAVLRREPGYNQFTVILDPAKTGHLTDLQKVVLADGGLMAPFGGYVSGDRVTVYTD